MLHIHRAERADTLVEALGEVMSAPLPDPFATEVVAVPTRGVERWISQRLSHRLGSVTGDGVCAGVVFPSPSTLALSCVAAVGGGDPDADPWGTDRLQWDVLSVLDQAGAAEDAGLGVVLSFLQRAIVPAEEEAHGTNRRLATAQELAALFAGYAEQRPDMLRSWVQGLDEDGTGQRLPDDLRWQAELWRRARERVLERTGVACPAEVLPEVLQRLRTDPAVVEIPARLSVFGPTRLSAAALDILAALAVHRAVHLWLPHPSPALWDRVQAHLGTAPVPRLRALDTTGQGTTLPLLESLGRDSRELQVRLSTLTATGPHLNEHHPARARSAHLLGRLQEAVASDAIPAPEPLAGEDFSLQLHACHGLPRQVEVLRELLVGLLADDPSLEPRDIVVMCPDVEAAAPLVGAAFGRVTAGEDTAHPGQRIRVRVADRSLFQVNPMLSFLGQLLALADARCSVEEVLGLLALGPVARRFALGTEELGLLEQWLPDAGVRWGLDAEHRARHGMPGIDQNTWRTGLDRLLLGVAMSEDGLPLVGGVLPFDDVASQSAELVGRLAEVLERLSLVLEELHRPQPLARWVEGLVRGLDLLAEVPSSEEWQNRAARRVLAEVLADAGPAAATTDLTLADVRVLLADRLAGRPTRAGFRTGDLTVCSLAPMRSVPHRVVVLLGMDDDAYPRTPVARGDDVLARRPLLGEREVRTEDRQILLDAVHAASERLLVLFTGMNPRTNVAEPPAVPVGELLDTVRGMVSPDDFDRLLVRHPLQPFDERNLTTGAVGAPRTSAARRPFSFDHAWRAAAEAARGERRAPTGVDGLRLPAVDPPEHEVDLEDLVAMLVNPARAFLTQRLHLRLPDEADPPPRHVPIQLDPLAGWAAGDRLLGEWRAGRGDRAVVAARARQTLPFGQLGTDALHRIHADVRAIAGAAPPRSRALGIQARLADGRSVTGTLSDVAAGGVIVTTQYARVSARHRLRPWLQLVVAAASMDQDDGPTPFTALLVGRGRSAGKPQVLRWGPLDALHARQVLSGLVALRDVGLTRVLPAAAESSAAYVVSARWDTRQAVQRRSESAARKAWDQRHSDAADPAMRLVWGQGLDALLRSPRPRGAQPPASMAVAGFASWFAELAHQIWAGPMHVADASGATS